MNEVELRYPGTDRELTNHTVRLRCFTCDGPGALLEIESKQPAKAPLMDSPATCDECGKPIWVHSMYSNLQGLVAPANEAGFDATIVSFSHTHSFSAGAYLRIELPFEGDREMRKLRMCVATTPWRVDYSEAGWRPFDGKVRKLETRADVIEAIQRFETKNPLGGEVHNWMKKVRVLTKGIGVAKGTDDAKYHELRKERAEIGLKLLRRGVAYRIAPGGATEFRQLDSPHAADQMRQKLEAIIAANGAVVTNDDVRRAAQN